MNRFILSLSIMVISCSALSQKQHFIYIQSEPAQVFFITMNEKIQNSTGSGYLILSRLKDTTYNFSVGFPQNKWPEHKFSVELKGKDRGYLLKDFGEKGWGLLDLQTSSIQMGSSGKAASTSKAMIGTVSPFTEILSRAANDPSLKEKQEIVQPVVVKDEGKAVIPEQAVVKNEAPTSKKDNSVVTTNEVPVTVTKNNPVEEKERTTNVKKDDVEAPVTESAGTITQEIENIPPKPYKRSTVIKRSESSTTEGLSLTFIDDAGGGEKDTITIFIPNQRGGLAEIRESEKDDRKFLDLANLNTSTRSDIVENGSDKIEKKVAGQEPVSPVAKKRCPSVATDADFLKLRKRMAGETNDEAMVDVAKKTFRTKCYSTAQVKNLSTMFLNDNGKYKFFDAAYSYVSDPDNFPALETEIKDEYYLNRFKAMVRPAAF